jgi:hypothetical protein
MIWKTAPADERSVAISCAPSPERKKRPSGPSATAEDVKAIGFAVPIGVQSDVRHRWMRLSVSA